MKLIQLQETKISPSTVAKKANQIKGLIGFEIECILRINNKNQDEWDDWELYEGNDELNLKSNKYNYDLVFDILNEHGLSEYIEKIVDDRSIKGMKSKEFPCEVVTKPLPSTISLDILFRIFDVLKSECNMRTTNSCGLHINVSTPKTGTNTDLVKLMMFLGETYFKKMFEREHNVFTQTIRTASINFLNQFKNDKLSDVDKYFQLRHHLKNVGKNFSFNGAKLLENYIEFRIPGGENYELQTEKITFATNTFLWLVYLADNPEYLTNEYVSKLYKFLNN